MTAPSAVQLPPVAGHCKKRIIVISGPTATGKTAFSLALAKLLGGEVISADSMQVYRGMNIGTAKIRLEEMGDVPHHMIDICDVHEPFNVVDYYEEASKTCREVLARGRVPIVVGGTGFYIHGLIYGPPEGPPSSPQLREKLEADMEKFGTEFLYEKLKELDSEYAATISHADRHKIIRALEIISLTNKRVSEFPNPLEAKKPKEFDFQPWFLYWPKEILYSRIEMRCDQMIAEGLEEEVKKLEKQGLRGNLSTEQAIGYRQCLEYLDSPKTDRDFEHFVWAFKQASRRYAKRQFTWFRKQPLFQWVNLSEHEPEEVIQRIIFEYRNRR